MPGRRDLVLQVLAAPLENGEQFSELHLVLGHVGGADRRPHDVDHRHRIGDDRRPAEIVDRARAHQAGLVVEDLGGRARRQEVHGRAVEHDVLLGRRPRQQHLARAAGEGALDELAGQARDPRFAVDARACVREPFE
jgi:hypothetical protein